MQNDPISPQLARRMMLWKLVFSRSQGGTTCTASPNKIMAAVLSTLAWSVVRGRPCAVVRGSSHAGGREWSCAVVRGRSWSVAILIVVVDNYFFDDVAQTK